MTTLQLKDGRTIDLKSRKVVGADKEEEAASHDEESLPSIAPKPRVGIKLEDLPTTPKQMNVVNAVIGYRLLGISDADIIYALGCTEEQFFHIVQSEAYQKCWQLCIDAFVSGQTATAKDIIANNAVQAATTLVNVMKTSRNENNKMRAAESVLNRMGINEANGASDGMGGGLVIKVVKDTQSDVTIKIGG